MQPTSSEALIIHQLDNLIDFTGLHQVNPRRYPFILESSAQAEDILAPDTSRYINPTSDSSSKENARYDILFAFPLQTLTLDSFNKLSGAVLDDKKDFLANLDLNWLENKSAASTMQANLPFHGGWFAYLNYELVGQIEKRLNLPRANEKSIIANLTRIPVAVIYDKHRDVQFIIAEKLHADKIQSLLDDVKLIRSSNKVNHEINLKEEKSNKYLKAIKNVQSYIKEGDVFQVNLSRLWESDDVKSVNAIELYESLKRSNPAPFSAYVSYEEYKIISSSPERLVKVNNGRVQTRPIAGTRARARENETADDIKSLHELISHPKERAEHIMLIDLERNDLGRVCVPGSIKVDELMVLESFQHVHHIVSNIVGDLEEGMTPGDVIRAVFPGGTITGCPKERCMQIIAELEAMPRGAYTGSVGYINHDGSMDLNILIRTFELSPEKLKLRAGAGLVADSIAQKELDETRAKAKGLLEALN